MTATFTPAQQKIIALAPKFPALLSVLGSAFIIAECVWFDRRKIGRVYNRLLLAMSICDVVESAFNFASSWPIPEGSPGVAFAAGNTRTCTAQGFFLQFGLAIPMLNMFLAVYYLLVIRHSWSEDDIRRRAEPWFYVAAFTISLGTCFASLGLKLFNNSNLWCWIAPYPLDCKDSFTYGEEGNCVRGDNAWIYRWSFYYAEIWTCILLVMIIMIAVYRTVWKLEQANKKYSIVVHNRQTSNNGGARGGGERKKKATPSKSKRVASQALWYVGAFYMTFLFSTINRVLQQTTGRTYFPLTVLHAIFDPAQGFLNYLVYIRPRYLTYREKNSDATFWMALRFLYSRDEASKRRAAREEFDEDRHDEEEARKELARWRMRETGKKVSGLFRSIAASSKSLFEMSSSSRSSLFDDMSERGEDSRHSACDEEGKIADNLYDSSAEVADFANSARTQATHDNTNAVVALNCSDDDIPVFNANGRQTGGIFRFVPSKSLLKAIEEAQLTIAVSYMNTEPMVSSSTLVIPKNIPPRTNQSVAADQDTNSFTTQRSSLRRSSTGSNSGTKKKRVSFHPDLLSEMITDIEFNNDERMYDVELHSH